MSREPYALGRAEYPALVVTRDLFEQRVAVALADPRDRTPLAFGDLYLACACTEGAPGAALTFQLKFRKTLRRAVSRVLTNPGEREEAEQAALGALLVGGGQPKLAQYLGKGPLENWIAVVAIRVAVSQGRAESAERRLREKAAADATGAASPELLFMKQELRAELEAAVGEALQRLPDRERLVLRLYLVSGMTLEAIGKTFAVTGSTVSRWLTSSRESIQIDVQRLLGERLKIARADLASFARLVMSELDVSVSRLLGAA